MIYVIFSILLILLFYILIKLVNKKVEIQHIDINSIKKIGEIIPYVKKSYFMTESELNFFRTLEKLNQNRYFIVPQISLSKLVSVEENELMKKTYHNKIDRKSVDFVLFDKISFSPKLVVELDDRSHDRYDRKMRDEWVDKIMNKVGIRIVHIKSSYVYDMKSISNLLAI